MSEIDCISVITIWLPCTFEAFTSDKAFNFSARFIVASKKIKVHD